MQIASAKATLNISAQKHTEALSVIAGILLLVLLLVNYPSAGVVREGDEGSGIGGTGRMAAPGSGFGGTGLKPFLGLNAQNEVEILQSLDRRGAAITASIEPVFEPENAAELAVVDPQFKLLAETAITRDSSAITIAESMQLAANNNALYFQQVLQLQVLQLQVLQLQLPQPPSDQWDIPAVDSSTQRSVDLRQSMSEQKLELAGGFSITPELELSLDEATRPAMTDSGQADSDNNAISWDSIARLLTKHAQTQTAQSSPADAQEISVTADYTGSLSRPMKIQRPELPPVQRLRPIQRASILPPRVQPMRL
jgi:hypothetical protein